MSPPVLRGVSPMVSTTSHTLKIALPARNVDDLVILFTQAVIPGSTGDGTYPLLPAGYRSLYASGDASGWVRVGWKRVTANEPDVVLQAPAAPTTLDWWGHVEVYGNVDYRDPGWLDVPGTAGAYGRLIRAAPSAPTQLQLTARVAFDALGVTNWISGWANGDVGFGLNSSNQPVIYATNTSAGIIGNAPASLAVPGLIPQQKVWLMGIVDTTTGACSYNYSFQDVEHYQSVSWTGLGAPVVGTGAGTTMRVTNAGTAFIGARDAATTPTKQQVFAYAEFADGVQLHNFNFSSPNPAGFTAVGATTVYRPLIGNASPIESFLVDTVPAAPDAIHVPALPVYGPDRLDVVLWFGTNTTGQVGNPILGPDNWTAPTPDRYASFANVYAKDVLRTKVVSADVETIFVPSTSAYAFGVYSLIIRPLVGPTLPPVSPQPPRLTLGCADSYGLWITDADYETRLDRLDWTGLTWGRALDVISAATATFPSQPGGVKCLARAGGLQPWEHGILIERNDQEVWRGPVVTVSRQGSDIKVTAADTLARFQKLPVVLDAIVSYTNADAGTIFRDVITTHSFSSANQWTLPCPLVTSGASLSRSLKPQEFKYAWDLMSELLTSAVDAYVMNGVLYVWEPTAGWQYQADLKRTLDGPYNAEYDFVYGMFTEDAFSTRPDWTIDGASQTNYAVVPGTETGEYGFRTFQIAQDELSQAKAGLLFDASPDPTEIPEDAPPSLVAQFLQARANTTIALRSQAPLSIDGGILSQRAPISIEHLRPGSLWKLDVFDDGYAELLSVCRLRGVTVTVSRDASGIQEVVAPMLEPPGWQGGF